MSDFIRDGGGQGYLARVNKDQQIVTRSTTVQQHTKSTLDGNYYEATTGQIDITDALENGIIFIKNNETSTIVVDKVFIDVWASTGGDANGCTLKYYKNPIVTGGSSITPVNTNFRRQDSAVGLDLKELTTILDGTTWWIGYFEPKSSIVIDEEKFCIPPGYSFGLSVQAPVGNTSMLINVNVAFYRFDEELA